MPDCQQTGFDWEMLGAALRERSETQGRYLAAPLGLLGELFATLAITVIEEFGEAGRNAVVRAVERFGEERGKRIAAVVRSAGRDLTFANFLIFTDLDTSDLEMIPSLEDGELRLEISSCPFATACRDWGMGEAGRLYCEHVDAAIMRGYNPQLFETVALQSLTAGADKCILVYRATGRSKPCGCPK